MAGLALSGAAGLLLALTPTPPVAHADAVLLQPGELVVNGGAELSSTAGWTGGLSWQTHGSSSGYPPSVITGPGGLTGETFDGGNRLFTGTGPSSVATQVIDLAPSSAAIDNGHVDAVMSAYIGGYANQGDNAKVDYAFRDATGTVVASTTFGPVLPGDRGNASGFIGFAETAAVPVGTRSVLVTITSIRFVAPANDGYVDNVSLVLDAPTPTGVGDAASTTVDVPVVIPAPANDVPGTGAAIVPGSLRLLDGSGLEVATLMTADGLYEIDPATGSVRFAPEPGFLGVTTAVPYRITDSSGQRAESTITVTVTAAPPAVQPAQLASAGVDGVGLGVVGAAIAIVGAILMRRRAH